MNRQHRSWRSITWLSIRFFFGTLPATFLLPNALMVMFYGLGFLASSVGASAVLIIWGGGGVFGAAALWGLSITAVPRPDWIISGLWSGLFSVLPLTLYAASELPGLPRYFLNIGSNPEGLLVVIAPLTLPVIACIELIRLRRESSHALAVSS